MYVVRLSSEAQSDLTYLRRHVPTAFEKAVRLLKEIEEHPRTGTGQVERLRHYKYETWSRRITREHRLVYEIHDEHVLVLVLTAYGHYEDK